MLFIHPNTTGRFKYWIDPQDRPLTDSWWFFTQAAACTYSLPPDQPYEKALRWFVPAQAKADTPTGPQPIHDDRLISAARLLRTRQLLSEDQLGPFDRIIAGVLDDISSDLEVNL